MSFMVMVYFSRNESRFSEVSDMKKIKSKNITMAYLFLSLFSVSLVAGFFKWVLFIPAALFTIAYVLLDKKCLRCPHCSGFTNLDRLSYAKVHIYHCSHCGERIEIEK